jgi:WD40 repeat protein
LKHEGIFNNVNVVAFHPDTAQILLATGCEAPNALRLWNITEPSSTNINNAYAIKTLAFHPSLPLLATGDDGNNLKLWNFDDIRKIRCVKTLNNVHRYIVSVAFHPTAPLLATGSWDHTAKVWSYSSERHDVKLVATHTYRNNSVNSVAFYPVPKEEDPILAIGIYGGYFETYELTGPSSGVSYGGTRRRTQTRTRRRSRKQQQRSRRRRSRHRRR